MLRTAISLFSLALVAGCGGPSVSPDGGSPGPDAPGVDAPLADAPREDAGDLAEGPLTVEILAPARGASLTGTRDPESPAICQFRTRVRVRVRGAGSADVDVIDVASDGTLGYTPIGLTDGPDGRVGEAEVSVGRLLDSSLPRDMTLAARASDLLDTEVRVVVGADSCP